MKFIGERVVPTDMHKNIDTYQQHLVRYVWALQFVVNKNVIDAACGTGYGTALMRTVANRVLGLDNSIEAITYARIYHSDTVTDIGGFLKADLDCIGIVNPLDVVVTFETLEHLKDPKKFIDWCKQTTSTIIGSIPINCHTPFHLHNYTLREAVEFVLNCGFKQYDLYYQDHMNITLLDNFNHAHGMLLFKGEVK